MLNILTSILKANYAHKLLLKIIAFFLVTFFYSVLLTKFTTKDDFFILNEEKQNHFSDNMWHYCMTTFTTTGYGDIVPVSRKARIISQCLMFTAFLVLIL